jgi:hypothetical protein
LNPWVGQIHRELEKRGDHFGVVQRLEVRRESSIGPRRRLEVIGELANRVAVEAGNNECAALCVCV